MHYLSEWVAIARLVFLTQWRGVSQPQGDHQGFHYFIANTIGSFNHKKVTRGFLPESVNLETCPISTRPKNTFIWQYEGHRYGNLKFWFQIFQVLEKTETCSQNFSADWLCADLEKDYEEVGIETAEGEEGEEGMEWSWTFFKLHLSFNSNIGKY